MSQVLKTMFQSEYNKFTIIYIDSWDLIIFSSLIIVKSYNYHYIQYWYICIGKFFIKLNLLPTLKVDKNNLPLYSLNQKNICKTSNSKTHF